jgi:hypothetical protein
MSKIIIQLQGGLVQDVFIQGVGNPTKAIVVDEDIEGAEPNEITTVKVDYGTLKNEDTFEAYIHTESIKPLPKGCDVEKIVKAYLKK